MTGYRCYFLRLDGKIDSAEDITAENRETALDLSRRMFAARRQHPCFELWQGGRKLHTERREPSMIRC